MKKNLSGRAAALFMASLMAVVFSACGDDENTTVQNDAAETTVSETVTEETSEAETSAETTAETTDVTTCDTSVSETVVTTEITSETAKAEEASAQQTEAAKDNNSGENKAQVTDDRFQPFIDGLADAVRSGSRFYEEFDNAAEDSFRIDMEFISKGFKYMFTDVNNDGQHELLVGYDHTDDDGRIEYVCSAFVVIDSNGKYKNLTSSWSRSRTSYVGGGYFLSGGSGGAALHLEEAYHYDASTYSLAVDANLITEYDEPDSSQLPIPNYSLYEGRMWSYNPGKAKDDPDVLHGDEAENKWNEYVEKAYAQNNELKNPQWIDAGI